MIDITENAIKRIKDISTKQESNLFRISVDGGYIFNSFYCVFCYINHPSLILSMIYLDLISRFQILKHLLLVVVEPLFQFSNDNNRFLECKLYKS